MFRMLSSAIWHTYAWLEHTFSVFVWDETQGLEGQTLVDESGSCLFFLLAKQLEFGHKPVGYSGAVRVKVKVRRGERVCMPDFLWSRDALGLEPKMSYSALPPWCMLRFRLVVYVQVAFMGSVWGSYGAWNYAAPVQLSKAGWEARMRWSAGGERQKVDNQGYSEEQHLWKNTNTKKHLAECFHVPLF